MIKEAKVNIDGLTVIAGENDTGKSTVGKALYYANVIDEITNEATKKTQKYIDELHYNYSILQELKSTDENTKQNLEGLTKEQKELRKELDKLWEEGDKKIEQVESKILANIDELNQKLISIRVEIQEKIFYFQLLPTSKVSIDNQTESKVIFIDTPILANFFDFFSMLDTVQNEIEYEVNNYPYLSRSLFKQLRLKLKKETTLDKYAMLETLKEIIGGELKTDSMGKLVFVKNDGSTHNVNAVATGIKNFGILQLLLKNNYLTKDAILIIDEPEVHLHPKWQLEMAKVIVDLVKNGVKVIVNSHSPYMIEALQRYSEKEKVTSDFYLAEDGYIHKIEDSNSQTLLKIFEKLSEPFDEFEEMDSESMENLLNG
ncbi:MAG: ATP-binding protein [Campylobacterales bacterium]|nr:ATP-binding protein [Campylobacterales bacterium]